MKLPSCRHTLRGWIVKSLCASCAFGVTVAAEAQDIPPHTRIVRPVNARPADARPADSRPAAASSISSASPEWAIATLRAGDASSVPARTQAIGILGTTFWQADAETEMALIFALRADPNVDVRAKAAATLGDSRYVTPKTFAALQSCAASNSSDGYPAEPSDAVRWKANDALRKHSRPANTQNVIAMQRETYRAKTEAARKSDQASRKLRDGAEESSPPDTKLEPPTIATPPKTPSGPTLVPPPVVNIPTAPAKKSEPPTTSTPPPPPTPLVPPPVMNKPATPATPNSASPIPTKPSTDVPAVKTVSVPPPSATRMDVNQPVKTEKATLELPPIPADDRNISMRQRRAELREMGLADPSLQQFQKEIGAPPPNTATPQSTTTTSQSGFRGLFNRNATPTPSDVEPVQVARPALPSHTVITPQIVSTTKQASPAQPTTTPPRPTTERIVEVTDVTQTSAEIPPARASSAGLWNRLFNRSAASPVTPPAAEPIPRTIDGQSVTPIATTPTLRTP
jgi:hypothetical protein